MRKLEGFFAPSPCSCLNHLGWSWCLNRQCTIHFRQRGLSGKATGDGGGRRVRIRDRVGRAVPAPEANAEIQANLDVSRTSFFILLATF